MYKSLVKIKCFIKIYIFFYLLVKRLYVSMYIYKEEEKEIREKKYRE